MAHHGTGQSTSEHPEYDAPLYVHVSAHAHPVVVSGVAGAAVSGAFSTKSHTVLSAEATPIRSVTS